MTRSPRKRRMVGMDVNLTLGFTPVPLAEPCGQIPDVEVGVPLEHLQSLVAGDRSDLHHVQSLLEESARGLLPPVAETEGADPGPPNRASGRPLEAPGRQVS